MSAVQSKPLPIELVSEMANFVPLKIVHKKCVIPTNVSLLMTSNILTGYLLGKAQKLLQLILEMSNPEFYRNDENELCVTNADGTALNSIDLMRHFCLNNVLLQRKKEFTIKDQLLPKDFHPIKFLGQVLNYARKCANPSTVGDYIRMHFPAIDEKELPDVLKMPEEKKKKLDPPFAEFFRQIISLRTRNGDHKFRLHFSVDRDYASFGKVDEDEDENDEEDEEDSDESMDNDDEENSNDEGMDNFDDADSDESME